MQNRGMTLNRCMYMTSCMHVCMYKIISNINEFSSKKKKKKKKKKNGNWLWHFHNGKWFFIHCSQIELEFRSVGFCAGRKIGEPRAKNAGRGREPTKTSTRVAQKSNPGHIGERR